MRALFVHDTFYSRDEHGHVYAHGAFPYRLWEQRFLPHFHHVTVIGRDKKETANSNVLERSDGPHLSFELLDNINTPYKRVFEASDIKKSITRQVLAHDVVIVRGPVEFAMMAAAVARKHGKPVAVEMSGCAFDHTWHHGSLAGKLYAPIKYLRAKRMVKNADFVMYVTEKFLQSRYPTRAQRIEVASNVELEDTSGCPLSKRLQRIEANLDTITFGIIGNFGNKLKGLSILLESLSEVKTGLPRFKLRILGQPPKPDEGRLIEELDLKNHVIFSGMLPGGSAVYDWLDDIDVYIQPSLHEGLPRALIEAMSRGCPALASDAGGTQELLEADNIHRRGHVQALSAHIQKSADKHWQIEQAQRNYAVAQKYARSALQPRRDVFWSAFADFARESQSVLK